MNNTVLKLQKVTKIFGGNGDVPLVEIFNGMDFSVKTNEVVGLFSPSGSGKTTFLQIADCSFLRCFGFRATSNVHNSVTYSINCCDEYHFWTSNAS